jgi:hypothetical protein
MASTRKSTAKPSATAKATAVPEHVSQEEAVAHLQALLAAKRQRVRQSPGWPGAAGGQPPHAAEGGPTPPRAARTLSGEAGHGHGAQIHGRGEQGRRGKS